jgi:hypothetical protein
MLIVSKYKDYYDIGHSLGIDKSIIYNRLHKNNVDDDILIPSELLDLNSSIETYHNILTELTFRKDYGDILSKSSYDLIEPFIIGFCGKLYLGFLLMKEENKFEKTDSLIYSNSKLSFVSIQNVTYDIKEILVNLKEKRRYSKKKIYDEIIEYKSRIENTSLNINNIFRQHNTPIFLFKKSNKANYLFEINTSLSDYHFYKVFDSYSAFQEISMFIGGVLGSNNKKIIEISNENKLTQHGFDKWSFRNPNPPKRKIK